ncbi:MAG: tRNA (N6-threonylcarbamoyladenosine(37)-N6)-methyltransferase TrmO [bacterium]|nr:tRNA (N6-threonylcarbamoyladenosine(37)-N6)-methyltransferase TrmO [bacterium]MDT8366649.1 tRNA (N6-threonylcarbamoyladenosine(37)-N6)-methyltransferase TrmO [bacterium]
MDNLTITPVGYIRSDVTERGQAPRQGRDADLDARIEILTPYTEALSGIGQWSQLLVICWMHLANRDILDVHPRGNTNAPLTGVFGTRSPARPNPLAVYTVDLLSVDGNVLHVKGIDAIDGTPVLDIKPHINRLDD